MGVAEEGFIFADGHVLIVQSPPTRAHPTWIDNGCSGIRKIQWTRLSLDLSLYLPAQSIGITKTHLYPVRTPHWNILNVQFTRKGRDEHRYPFRRIPRTGCYTIGPRK